MNTEPSRSHAAKKSLGQHWLYDDDSLEAMVEAAQIHSGDTVLEIGPGLGTLTEKLLHTGAEVHVVEFDEALIPKLRKKFKDYLDKSLWVKQADIRTFDLGAMSQGYKVVANIPYYLTSNLIQNLSENSNPPAIAALLIQKEVAERLAAKPGNLSVLGITAQYYWEVELGRKVSAELFTPPPKVDSQIVILKRREQVLLPNVDTKEFFRIVKAGFSQKRKTLLNSLGGGLRLTREQTLDVLNQAGIQPTARAQMLSLEDWHKIYKALG